MEFNLHAPMEDAVQLMEVTFASNFCILVEFEQIILNIEELYVVSKLEINK